MARLQIKTDGFENRVFDLNLGVNRVGRAAGNDFRIEHATVSARHCELVLGNNTLRVRDCDSTNGTFVDGRKVTESALEAGQVLALGDVELIVETTEVKVAIPRIDVQMPAPPVVLTDGSLICPRHPGSRATHQCTHCREVLCDACVSRLRRRGGKLLKLCSLCSHAVERIGGEPRKKKSLLQFLHKTVKLPFVRDRREPED